MSFFLMIALIGFLFLAISALGGHDTGGDHEVHADIQVDHDVGHDPSHDTHHTDDGNDEHTPSPFSIRVIAVSLAAFGVAGEMASQKGFGLPISSLIGMLVGTGAGTFAHQLIKYLWAHQADSTVMESDLIGKAGEVKTAIPASGLGQISIEVKGRRLYLPAKEIGGDSIEEGAQVCVVEDDKGIVTVLRM